MPPVAEFTSNNASQATLVARGGRIRRRRFWVAAKLAEIRHAKPRHSDFVADIAS